MVIALFWEGRLAHSAFLFTTWLGINTYIMPDIRYRTRSDMPAFRISRTCSHKQWHMYTHIQMPVER